MLKRFHLFCDAAAGDDAAGGAGGGTGDQAAPGGATDAAASGNAAPASKSVLGDASTQTGSDSFIPAKYHVKKDDQTLDLEASARKMAEAYTSLEKRLGSGDAPPKADTDYKVTLPEQFKTLDLEKDESFVEFRKAAHAAGLNQAQFDLVMGKYFEIAPALVEGAKALSYDECLAELKKEWPTDEKYKEEVAKAGRAIQAYGGNDAEGLVKDYGNDPRFVRMMNRIGGELGEDTPPNPGNGTPNTESIEAMMMSDAYKNPKNPEHAKVSRQVAEHFAAMAKAAERAGNVPLV